LKVRNIHIIAIFPLVLAPAASFAQIVSVGGTFTANYVKGCAGMAVEVRNIDPATGGTDEFNFDYRNNPGDFHKTPLVHVYNTPGVYWIAHQFQAVSGDYVLDSLMIEVRLWKMPDYLVAQCDDYHLSVEIEDDKFDWYRIYFTPDDSVDVPQGAPPVAFDYQTGDPVNISVRGYYENGDTMSCPAASKTAQPIADFTLPYITQVATLRQDANKGLVEIMTSADNDFYNMEYSPNGTGSFTHYGISESGIYYVENLNTADNYYCFRLSSSSACPGSPPEYSEPVCGVRLQAEALNNENRLAIVTDYDFTTAQILRNNIPVGQTGGSTFVDDDVVCGGEYCYQAILDGAVISAQQCVAGVSDDIPPAIDRVAASFTNNGVEIEWEQPAGIDVAGYTIFRSEGIGGFGEIAQTAENVYDDHVAVPSPVCYRIAYEDACGNISAEGREACPVILSLNADGGDPALSWTDYRGFDGGVDYYAVEKTGEDGRAIEIVNLSGAANEYTEPLGHDQVIFYRILAVSGQDTVFSNRMRATFESRVFFPNAFTPDGDNLNNTFKPVGRFFKSYELRIYTRWGEPVFYTTDPQQGWDGTYLGRDAPQGVYVYTAVITDSEGTRFERKGTVHLLRKR